MISMRSGSNSTMHCRMESKRSSHLWACTRREKTSTSWFPMNFRIPKILSQYNVEMCSSPFIHHFIQHVPIKPQSATFRIHSLHEKLRTIKNDLIHSWINYIKRGLMYKVPFRPSNQKRSPESLMMWCIVAHRCLHHITLNYAFHSNKYLNVIWKTFSITHKLLLNIEWCLWP